MFHESMTEYSGLMLMDHLHDIVAIAAQPMLLSFADGRVHYPDFFAVLADGRRLLIDVHLSSRTSEADAESFELTRALCARVGWDYELIHELDQVARWNIEWFARYRHPRCAPTPDEERRILTLARTTKNLGGLRRKLRTDTPGEHLAQLYNLIWNRAILLDVTKPLTDATPIWVA